MFGQVLFSQPISNGHSSANVVIGPERSRVQPTRVRHKMRPGAHTPLKIERKSHGQRTIVSLTGRIHAEDLDELKAQIGDNAKDIVLDFNEVTLVDGDLIRFLSTSQEARIALIHCPPCVREWILLERAKGRI
ncbi:MAG: hypothetical protein C5B58_12585 [Acidobacteria bacterium]|nr:MAG: hypothetical protein C5B58_12585 [Acidobacteriota bacterium]